MAEFQVRKPPVINRKLVRYLNIMQVIEKLESELKEIETDPDIIRDLEIIRGVENAME